MKETMVGLGQISMCSHFLISTLISFGGITSSPMCSFDGMTLTSHTEAEGLDPFPSHHGSKAIGIPAIRPQPIGCFLSRLWILSDPRVAALPYPDCSSYGIIPILQASSLWSLVTVLPKPASPGSRSICEHHIAPINSFLLGSSRISVCCLHHSILTTHQHDCGRHTANSTNISLSCRRWLSVLLMLRAMCFH